MTDPKNETTLQDHDLVVLPGFRYLGAGYDIFGEYASPESIQKQVFDLSPFLNEEGAIVAFNGRNYRFPLAKSGYFTYNPRVVQQFEASAGETIDSFREDMSMSLNGEGIIGAFTGSLSMSEDTSIFKETDVAYSISYYLDNNYELEVFFDRIKSHSDPYLVDLLKTLMDEAQTIPQALDIMEQFGTHVVLQLKVGKRSIQYAASSKSLYKSTTDFKLLANAAFADVLKIDAGYKDKTTVTKFQAESDCKWHYYGTDAQNTIVGFPDNQSLVPIWEVYKNNNNCLSDAFERLTKTYQFITALIGKNQMIVTDIDFSHSTSTLRERGFEIIKNKGEDADMRQGLSGSYIYMGIKQSSLLEVLQGAQPVTKIIKTVSSHSHPKQIEGYTPIHCDFLQSVDGDYEFAYYAQIDLSMPKELTDLLQIGLTSGYESIKEQAYTYAADDAKFQLIETGLQQLQNVSNSQKDIYSSLVFSSKKTTTSYQIYHTYNPFPKEHYLSEGYAIISENLISNDDYAYNDYLYILGKPLTPASEEA